MIKKHLEGIINGIVMSASNARSAAINAQSTGSKNRPAATEIVEDSTALSSFKDDAIPQLAYALYAQRKNLLKA